MFAALFNTIKIGKLMIVYHYTSKQSFDEIIRTSSIKPSDPWTTMDATFGEGWYFTDLGPNICDMEIMYYCWRNTSVFDRLECYMKFDIHNSILQSCRPHVYMVAVDKWNADSAKYLEGGATTNCSSKPCATCEKGKMYRISPQV